MNFIKAMWNYYVLGTWYYFFPPKSEDDPGDDQAEPCSPGHCNHPTGCFAPKCYGRND